MAAAAHNAALAAHRRLEDELVQLNARLGQQRTLNATQGEARPFIELQERIKRARERARVALALPAVARAEREVQTAQDALEQAQERLAAAKDASGARRAEAKLAAYLAEAQTARLREERATVIEQLERKQAKLRDATKESYAELTHARRALVKTGPAKATRLPLEVLGRIFEFTAAGVMDDVAPPPALFPALVISFVCKRWREAALDAHNGTVWTYVNVDLDDVLRLGGPWLDRVLARSRTAATLRPLRLRVQLRQPSTDAHRPLFYSFAAEMGRVLVLTLDLRSLSGDSEPALPLLSSSAPRLRRLTIRVQNFVDREAVPPVLFTASTNVFKLVVSGCDSLSHAAEPLLRGCGATLQRAKFDGVPAGGALARTLMLAPKLRRITIRNCTVTSAFFDALATVDGPKLHRMKLHGVGQAVSGSPAGVFSSLFDVDNMLAFVRARVKLYEQFKLLPKDSDELAWKDGVDIGKTLQTLIDDAARTAWRPPTITILPRPATPPLPPVTRPARTAWPQGTSSKS